MLTDTNRLKQAIPDTPEPSGWKTHHFGTTLEDGSFFHLDLLGHQNIKTSLNFLDKNHWARPFFALFSSIREKLRSVSFDHPVPWFYCILHFSVWSQLVGAKKRQPAMAWVQGKYLICICLATHVICEVENKLFWHCGIVWTLKNWRLLVGWWKPGAAAQAWVSGKSNHRSPINYTHILQAILQKCFMQHVITQCSNVINSIFFSFEITLCSLLLSSDKRLAYLSISKR